MAIVLLCLSPKNAWSPAKRTYVYANRWVTTENALRREHGLPQRVAYSK